MIFVLGCALFYLVGQGRAVRHFDHFEFLANCVAALFLAVVGIFGCYFPIQFMKVFVVRLRRVPAASLDDRARKIMEASGKIFGALFLLGASFVTHLVVTSS
jgi:hypothetical protein